MELALYYGCPDKTYREKTSRDITSMGQNVQREKHLEGQNVLWDKTSGIQNVFGNKKSGGTKLPFGIFSMYMYVCTCRKYKSNTEKTCF
jgi:hypothetical protein